MKVKLAQVQRAQQALQKLLSVNFPIKTAFKLSRMIKPFNAVLADIEEQRTKLVKQHGEPVEDGFKVKEDCMSVFQQELFEFLQEEVDLEVEPIRIDLLEGTSLTSVEVDSLGMFLI